MRPRPLFETSSLPTRATINAGLKQPSRASLAGLLVGARGERLTPSLLAFVFSSLRLRRKKLEFSLRSPFDLMARASARFSNARIARQRERLRKSTVPAWGGNRP